ncbi:MAG: threonine--tRNA ligase [Nanoarchaeota archaeon]|nr:threonine--tRNA ligase [Nanoarchaeota archaeon]
MNSSIYILLLILPLLLYILSLLYRKEMAKDLETLRHSTSHVLAEAVKELFPEVKLGIGPAIEDGFYYDFDRETPFTPEDLKKIQEKMREIIKKKEKFEKFELEYAEAKKQLKNEPYKLELLKDLKDKGEKISFYKSGKFTDLCAGPHVESTSDIKAYKLLKVAGAYWRGDSKNKQLQRIYGTSFESKEELKEYLRLREEAEKRDHRKLGKKLELFSFHEEAPGMAFFLPKGMIIWNTLTDFWRKEHDKAGYVEVKTPIMMNKHLWETSGHWDNYRENMYTTMIDEMDYAVKPMNCPGGMLIYKEKTHSYREFPLRVGEIGLVHRHELSGVLSGLFRVRSFHQDDAHIFMTEDQITQEVLGVLNLSEKFYSQFGLTFSLELSTRPEKSIGTDEQWEKAIAGLKNALGEKDQKYVINEGDGAFYGPKVDLHIKDALGRTWQCGTIQLDMSLPERFDLTYEGEDGKKHRPVMIHRVIYGSMERFMGILVEHYAGKFPLWLSPVQVKLLPIADRHVEFCKKVLEKMKESGLRVELDDKAETTNKKVRNAQVQQVNYILVIGDNEIKNKTVNVRTRDNKVHGEKKVDAFIKELLSEVEAKK